ncbi:MAG: hypothetical protein H0T46_29395 [Deltaproteobacteria bacterium]|nr:hypothetical protein [Deltaproteobacteria bacterium]
MRMLLALVLLAAACKTDEPAKPPPTPAKLEVAPAPAPAATPTPAVEAAEPTRSQQALVKRTIAFTNIAITAKKNQRDCAKLASHVPALVEGLRAVSALRADLEPDDAETDLQSSNVVLKQWLEIVDDCKDPSKFEPVMNALIEESKR